MIGMRALLVVMAVWSPPTLATAREIQPDPAFVALGSDRIAQNVGDTLTVLVLERSHASRSTSMRASRGGQVEADASGATSENEKARLRLEGGFEGGGQNGRSGDLVAQIGASVETVRPSGDLVVGGEQVVTIDGERTRIRFRGVVRPRDISPQNTVVSSRMSEIAIDYDGQGFTTRTSRPGLVLRVLSWLGAP